MASAALENTFFIGENKIMGIYFFVLSKKHNFARIFNNLRKNLTHNKY